MENIVKIRRSGRTGRKTRNIFTRDSQNIQGNLYQFQINHFSQGILDEHSGNADERQTNPLPSKIIDCK